MCGTAREEVHLPVACAKAPLPDGEGYTVVVQVKADAESKPKNFRIPLVLHTCKGCGNAEYACICDE